jgi:hypothetical protein
MGAGGPTGQAPETADFRAVGSGRSARVQKLWHAAGLGILARVEDLLEGATTDEINNAFGHAWAAHKARSSTDVARPLDRNHVLITPAEKST